MCRSDGIWIISEKGCNIHAFENLNLLNKVTLGDDRGILQPLKIIIDKYLEDDRDITAKRIYIKLVDKVYKEFKHLKDKLPTLTQVIS